MDAPLLKTMGNKEISRFLLEHILSSTAYWICAGYVLTKLTEYVGLPLAVAGVVTQLPSTLLALQLLGGIWFGRARHRRRSLLASNLVWRVSLGLIFFTVLLPGRAAAFAMVLLFLLAQVAYQVCFPAQTAWQIEAVEKQADNRFYTLRESGFMAVYSVCLLAVQFWIACGNNEEEWKRSFVWAGILTAGLLASATWFLFRLPSPAEGGSDLSWRQLMEPFRSRTYRNYICINTAWGLYNVFVSSFAVLYAVRILHVDFFSIMLWSTVGNFMRAAGANLTAWMAKHLGWKATLSFFVWLGIAIAMGWWWAKPEKLFLLFPVLTVLAPVPIGAMVLGMFQLQAKCAPAPARSVYFSVNSAVAGTVCFAGTLVCSALIEMLGKGNGWFQLKDIFLVGAIFGGITLVFIHGTSQDRHRTVICTETAE